MYVKLRVRLYVISAAYSSSGNGKTLRSVARGCILVEPEDILYDPDV